jgi:hypothetical protein
MRNRPVSAGSQIRIRQKRRFLPLLAEPFWLRIWEAELDKMKSKIHYFSSQNALFIFQFINLLSVFLFF